MNLTDILDESRIVENLNPGSKQDVLRELALTITSQYENIDTDTLVKKLLERESLCSTGIGDGIAIPHCKDESIDSIIMAFGRSTEGLDFDAIDKQPVNIIFLLIAPNTQKAAGEHLRTLAKITRILRSGDFKRKLLESEDAKGIFKLISEEDNK